jgi:glycerate kinase
MNLSNGIGALEMARVCGLSMVPKGQRDILHAGSGGLGEAIHRLIARGVRQIHVGVGGSASCDGGAGMLLRLQEGLTSSTSAFAHYSAANLADGHYPDVALVRSRMEALGVKLTVYSDVQSPLLGENGAAKLFGPQKGASPDDVELLEEVMDQWSQEVERQVGRQFRDLPGTGAGGGVGLAFAALGFPPVDGATRVFEHIGLTSRLSDCDSLMTCEGRFDRSSLVGKAPWKAALRAKAMGCKAVILCGAMEAEATAEAALRGIRVIEFGREIPEARRSAESFSKLSEKVRLVLRGLA